MIWGVAILTMLVGSVVALTQTDVKRMLAYSSIAHAGFVLVGMAATDAVLPSGELLGVSSVLFYLLAYGFTTIGAFAVVTLVRDSAGEATHLSQWAGLAGARRCSRPCSRSSCWRSPASRSPAASPRSSPSSAAAWEGGAWVLVVVGVVAERGRGVLLRPGHRADVLHRAGGGRPDGRGRRAR